MGVELWLRDSRTQQHIVSVVQFHSDRKSHLSTAYMIWTYSDSSYQRDKHDSRKFRVHLFHFGMFQQGMVLKLERLHHRNGQQGMDSEHSQQCLKRNDIYVNFSSNLLKITPKIIPLATNYAQKISDQEKQDSSIKRCLNQLLVSFPGH